MTDKQDRFCEEYMIDLNATQAAIRAGYSPKTAREQAPRLLANVSIQNRIAQLQAEQSRRTGVSADRVVRELAKIAFAKNVTPLLKSRGIDFALVFAINETQLNSILKEVLPELDEGDSFFSFVLLARIIS